MTGTAILKVEKLVGAKREVQPPVQLPERTSVRDDCRLQADGPRSITIRVFPLPRKQTSFHADRRPKADRPFSTHVV